MVRGLHGLILYAKLCLLYWFLFSCMPIQSAAFKALRRSQKRRLQNHALKLGLKKFNVRLRKALTAKQPDQARDLVRQYTRALDKAVKHGLLHRNTAGRKKSRIAAQLKKVSAK